MSGHILKNKLMNVRTGEVLMDWEVFRYPTNDTNPDGETIVEFAGSIVDETFGKNTFSFFSQDEENYYWLFDPEQKLSTRKSEEIDNNNIVGGPTKLTFDTRVESEKYMIYIMETLNAAAIYFATKEDTVTE
jgi:hypothetical protein